MVIGGQNFNASSREHDMVHQVEVLGRDKTCEVIYFSWEDAALQVLMSVSVKFLIISAVLFVC